MLFKVFSRALVVAGFLVVAGASNAIADTQTKTVGSQSGDAFKVTCPTGNALVGWAYNATDRVTAIAPLCQPINDTMDAVTGTRPESPGKGVGADIPGALQGDPQYCPDAGIMRSLSVFLTESLQVHHIRMTCKAPNHAPVITKPTTTNGGTSTADSKVDCPTRGSYATGLIGTYSKSKSKGGIISLGLTCFSADEPKTDEPKTDEPTTDEPKTDDTADNGDDGDNDVANVDDGNGNDGNGPGDFQITIGPDGITFGPKGKIRTLKEASTLYSDKGNTEIAYFDKGDKVVVVGCEQKGQGWCQVIKPQPGLIWGGDLK